jgi:drug/metabolite transporter (DMT)-like permease
MPRTHVVAVLQALFVTFLWATSWVLIKIGLEDIPALTFAGLRYGLATLVLLPFVLRGERLAALRRLPGRTWRDLIVLGLVWYALTQGAQFLALSYLPAATASLVLSFSPVLVAVGAAAALAERMVLRQWIGIGVYLAGALVYFAPAALPREQFVGLVIAVVGLLANATASVLGRSVNRTATVSPVVVTVVSMAVGSVVLLGTGLTLQGLPALSLQSWAIIAWLAVINTAVAFTLWNATLRHLSAVESSVVNNTMLIQIAILAWLFLGESLSAGQIVGICLAAVGALIVQLRGPSQPAARTRRRDRGA